MPYARRQGISMQRSLVHKDQPAAVWLSRCPSSVLPYVSPSVLARASMCWAELPCRDTYAAHRRPDGPCAPTSSQMHFLTVSSVLPLALPGLSGPPPLECRWDSGTRAGRTPLWDSYLPAWPPCCLHPQQTHCRIKPSQQPTLGPPEGSPISTLLLGRGLQPARPSPCSRPHVHRFAIWDGSVGPVPML